MTTPPDLSAVRGDTALSWRAATVDDSRLVLDLVAKSEEHDVGERLIDEEDILGDWQRPSFDLAAESVAVFDEGRLVAYGEIYQGRRAEVTVDPAERGRELGSALLRWTQDVSRLRGGRLVGQTVVGSSDAVALFEANGYTPRWTSWILELPLGAEPAQPQLPANVSIRAFQPGRDEQETYEVVENAFSEWADRDPTTFDDWAAGTLLRPGFEPSQLQLAVETAPDGAEAIVGVAHVVLSEDEAWINQLATRADRRGRGLGRALLVGGFETGGASGAARCLLSTDSRTGALGLYEHVGMRVTQTFVHYACEV